MTFQNYITKHQQSWLKITILTILSVFISSYVAYAHGTEPHDEIQTNNESNYPIVSVRKATPAYLEETGFEVSGIIHSKNQTEVYPLKSGNITQLYVDTGDYVQKGDLLARITPEKSDSQIGSEINLLKKEIEVLKERKNISSENTDAKIKLLEDTTIDKKSLLAEKENTEAITNELAVLIKQYETDIESLNVQIKNSENQLAGQEGIILNSATDMIDATANFLYTNPLYLQYTDNPLQYLRSELLYSKDKANTISKNFLDLHKQYRQTKLNELNITEFAAETLLIAQESRQLSNISPIKFSEGNEFHDKLSKLDEAIDHYGEVQTSNADLIAQIQNLKTEKITKNLELEQKKLEINQILNNLDRELQINTKELQFESALEQKDIDIQIRERQAKIDSLQKQWGWGTDIRAPFSGNITARHLTIGSSVNTNKPIFSIVDDSQKFVRFYITEDQYPFIKEGKTITFASKFSPSKTFTTNVSRISKSLSISTKQILVEADITNENDLDRIIPNMSVRVQIPLFSNDTKEANNNDSTTENINLYTIPESALELSKNSNTIWIVNDNIQAEKRSIKIDFFFDGSAYISDGLNGNEWIIVKSPVDLFDTLEVDTKIFSKN